MHLKALERVVIGSMTISAEGPLLIQSGNSEKINPEKTDANFLTSFDDGTEKYVIPGSSLKGVIRHYAEDNAPYLRLNDTDINSLFGSSKNDLIQKSRFSISDAYAVPETVHLIHRTNTALSSVAQSAKGGSLNNINTPDRGDFPCSFRIINASDKDIFTVLQALDAMNRQILFLGGRTGTGFGRVSIKNFQIRTVCMKPGSLNPETDAAYEKLSDALAAYRPKEA